ncbi:MAG: NAD(P)H-binding protein [Anaerolineales bacterium]|jgi:putative NADH-flavin reductase
MKITILGSTGFVGKVVLKKALEQGYQVKTLVRDPKKLGTYKDKVEYVSGDVSQAEKLEKAVKGADIVISTLPPTATNSDPEKSAKIMEQMVTTMEKQGIKRFIHIGGAVHGGGIDENWTLSRRLLRTYLNIVCKPVLVAKQMEWDILRKSNLDWILVRPPRITKDKPLGPLAVDEKNLGSVKVNVEDLAEFLLEQIHSEKWVVKAPLVATVSR